ncbi:MAG: bifunctional glycosyltransferase family 2/GtrA family protein [Clostridia bacterium]|nr:bifunctional glycosyltransferase family 2/GtrA family protein [Clostridia bacterium]
MNKELRVVAVVPSLNPDEKLKSVVEGLLEQGFFKVLLVDDGSAEDHKHRFAECVALDEKVELLVHEVNRGKGAAMKTAFAHILKKYPKCEGAVTVDGDAQHHPEDCRNCAEKMVEKDCVILGVRDFSGPDVPKKSRMGNRITSLVFKLFCGMKLSDTQTGLRAFPMDVLPQMLKTRGERYEYETQMLLDFKSLKIPYAEEKIRTVYIEENQTSHFRVVKDSFRIYKMIFAHFFKYIITSFASYLLELSVVSGVTVLMHTTGDHNPLTVTAVAYVVARAISSLFNFFMNQKFVFKAKCSMKKSLWKYYALCIPLAVVGLVFNMAGVGGAVWLDFLPPAVEEYVNLIIHPLVQIVMFLFTFAVQREWVYKTDSKHRFKRKKKNHKNRG